MDDGGGGAGGGVPAVAVTVAAADSNCGQWLWLGAVHILQKWQMAVTSHGIGGIDIPAKMAHLALQE